MAEGELALREERLVAAYASAKKRILGELTKAALPFYNEAGVEKARKNVREIVAGLRSAALREAGTAVRASFRDQAQVTATQAEILGLRLKPRTPAGTGLAESLSRLRRYLDEANGTILKSADNFFAALRASASATARIQEFDEGDRALYVEEVAAAALVAVASNWSRRRLQSMLLEKLFKLVESGDFIVINGRNYDISKYAKMVARTEMRRAQTAASKETCGRYGCDLVEWSRHANACKLCVPHEGKVFSLSGKDPAYPPLGEFAPPLHPNCGHSILATSREAIAAREEM